MAMTAKHALGLLVAGSILASCGAAERLRPKKGEWFDGHQYRSRVETVGDQREEFRVTINRASQSAEGARQAGAHAAVRYCIKNYGLSDVEWAAGQGPDEDGIEARIVDDQLVLRGRCKGWD